MIMTFAVLIASVLGLAGIFATPLIMQLLGAEEPLCLARAI